MKILFVIPTLSYRGAERYAYNLARGLSRLGNKAQILSGRVEEHTFEIRPRISLIQLPNNINRLLQNNLVYFFLTFPVLVYLLLRNARDVDVIDTESGFALWASVFVGKLRGIKVVWTVHVARDDSPPEGLARKLVSFAFFLIDKFFIKGVDGVKTVAFRNTKILKKLYGIKNPKVILPPVDLERLRRPDSQKVIKRYKLKGKKILLMPGVLHPNKNQELVIDCLPRILKEFPNTALIFLGEGADGERLKRLVKKKNIADKVIFAGVAKGSKIADYYAACDLILVPSWKAEGIPIIPFEGMAVGTLSIVARGSGASDVIEEQKIGIVADTNLEDFLNAILTYLRHPDKFEKLKRRGRAWVLEEMHPDKLTEDNLKFYKSVLGRDK